MLPMFVENIGKCRSVLGFLGTDLFNKVLVFILFDITWASVSARAKHWTLRFRMSPSRLFATKNHFAAFFEIYKRCAFCTTQNCVFFAFSFIFYHFLYF